MAKKQRLDVGYVYETKGYEKRNGVIISDLIETLDSLTGIAKRLLDICCEQAQIIEEHGIVSREYSEKNRGEMESFKEILKKAAGG